MIGLAPAPQLPALLVAGQALQIRGPLARLDPERQAQPRLQDDEALKEAAMQASMTHQGSKKARSQAGRRGVWGLGWAAAPAVSGRNSLGSSGWYPASTMPALALACGTKWKFYSIHCFFCLSFSLCFVRLQVEQQLAVTSGKHDNWGDMYAGERAGGGCGCIAG